MVARDNFSCLVVRIYWRNGAKSDLASQPLASLSNLLTPSNFLACWRWATHLAPMAWTSRYESHPLPCSRGYVCDTLDAPVWAAVRPQSNTSILAVFGAGM